MTVTAAQVVVPSSLPPLWEPQPGSQQLILACPVYELLNDGTRGAAKTDTTLFDYYRDVGRGFGRAWRGILFRRTYPELAEVVERSKQWFSQLPERPSWNGQEHQWTWSTGETLRFRYAKTIADYWSYHGHQYPWIGWEELTTWPNLDLYHRMKSCNRSTAPGVPRRIRPNTNPYGPGHNAVKSYFVDPAPQGRTLIRNPNGDYRIRITSYFHENIALSSRDPGYLERVTADQPPHIADAWARCRWDIVAGGMFDDVFRRQLHVIANARKIPTSWRVDRSYDWGSSHPWCVLWHAEADGEAPMELEGGLKLCPPRGTVVTFSELYGCTGKPNEGDRATSVEQARRLLDREAAWRSLDDDGRLSPHPGPADNQIESVDDGESIADKQRAIGVSWTKSHKEKGSRAAGWDQMRSLLKASAQRPQETAGWLICVGCTNLIRTLAGAPRSETKPDDLDPNCEDHALDAARYRLMTSPPPVESAGPTDWI